MKKLAIPAVLVLCISSCAPPYDGTAGDLIALLGKLHKEVTVGPLANSSLSLYDENVRLYPELSDPTTTHGIDTTRLFLTYTTYGSMEGMAMQMVQEDAQHPGSFTNTDVWSGTYSTTGSSSVRYGFRPVKGGDFLCITSLSTDPTLTALGVYQVQSTGLTAVPFNPVIPATGFQSTATTGGLAAATPPAVNFASGVSLWPLLSTTDDATYWLYQNGSALAVEIFQTIGSAGGAGIGLTRSPPLAPPVTFTNPLGNNSSIVYYYSPVSARSYGFVPLYGDTWTGWWWDSPSHQVKLPAGMHRIDALLTTGELFSTEKGTGRLYDADGNQEAEFPLGKLRYLYETYVDGVPQVLFCLLDRSVDGAYFDIYSIKTADLKSLAP